MRGHVWVIMGGQFGSEGKGDFVTYFSSHLHKLHKLGGVIRTGGPNAGHTMTFHQGDEYQQHKMRQIPCAWHCHVPLFIGPGSLINKEVLDQEFAMVRELTKSEPNLFIDNQALIIDPSDIEAEEQNSLRSRVGSTMEGIGSARSRHIMRQAELANSHYPGTVDVADMVNSILESGKDVIVESTQGFGLSLTASGYYPYATSRDVTPGIILNDAGLSSRTEHSVISVLRTYPIRVAGNSGPTGAEETSFEDLGVAPEHTTVTKLQRRIFHYDGQDVRRMGVRCRPDYLVLTFVDYLDRSLYGETDMNRLLSHPEVKSFIDLVQADSRSQVRWLATGPGIINPLPKPIGAAFGFNPYQHH